MGLNCKPEQLVWIDVPRTRENETLGLLGISGHVVTTKQLHPDAPAAEPTWQFEPAQSVKVTRAFISQYGLIPADTVLRVNALPDAWLRPFKDFPPGELEDLRVELERELAL